MGKQRPPVPLLSRESWRNLERTLNRAARSAVFRKCYVIFALSVLFGTTLLWALLGARLQIHNADQLSDPYLFSSWKTFHGAFFPGQHTFLLKWPLFWLISLFGVNPASLLVATLAVVFVTIAALVFVLYKIDRRPLVFGTVCLALSLALLLVPAQPAAGTLLPVNMAMLTTRNIEYAVYLAALLLIARAHRIKSCDFAAGAALLAVLIASDKLFLGLSLGGALLALVIYAVLRAWRFVTFAVYWLLASVVAAMSAMLILFTISASHLTNLVNSNTTAPYSLASSAQKVTLGAIYGVLGLFTNTGANPAYDNSILRQLPASLIHRLWSPSGPAYVAAAVGLLYALLLAWRLVWCMPRSKPRMSPSTTQLLALALIWSTVASLGVFVASDHYYPVDARYLAVGLFALVVAVSTELRKYRWSRPENLLLVAGGLLVAIVLATSTSVRISRGQTTGLSDLGRRNSTIATVLQRRRVNLLVGSYWRVLPIKLAMHGRIAATPLMNCTQPDVALTSNTWQPNLRTHGFAYLLTVNGSVAGFPACSIATVVAAYGRPNATQVVAGTLAKPDEVLLFYTQGSKPPVAVGQSATSASILPIKLDKLVDTGCLAPTIMNFVAHEDDDLLFMNPNLLREIHVGDCVRTVYLTAGNDGRGKLYWIDRQLGAEAAYSNMLGGKPTWLQQTVELTGDEYVTVASPKDNAKVALIFFNLPDGNLQGQGFSMSHFQSLAKLSGGVIASTQTVDGQSSYTAGQLVSALAQLMQAYRPSEIHTQADVPSDRYPDHSDHITTGRFVQSAAAFYDQQEFGGVVTTPIERYIGYPIHGYPANLSDVDLRQKDAAFMAYAHFDGSVCQSIAQCAATPTYGSYLAREYIEDPNQP